MAGNDEDDGANAAALPAAPVTKPQRRALPLPAGDDAPSLDTNPGIRIESQPEAPRPSGPPTQLGKRVEIEVDRTIDSPRAVARGDGEWRTRITKVQAVKQGSSAGDACLVLLYPPGSDMGKRFPLTRDMAVGRGADCDIQVDRDSISRRHALVFKIGDTWSIEDLQSTNGSYVNDVPVSRSVLRDGDFVKIGAAIFKFLVGAGVEAGYHEEIYRMTIVDALTGAYNKRYFIETLEREIVRCLRYQRPLSLVMFDLDHFKQVNEKHGHLTGDYVLRELARRILSRVRREEVFARYGGEEFAILLPESDLRAATELAEQVRRLVADQPFEYEGEALEVTISLGVATLQSESSDLMAFIKNADDNLYRAKREGRNRVVGGGAGEWSRWKANPSFRSSVSSKTAIAALSLLARDQMLATQGGAARVDDLEGILHARLSEHAKSEIMFGALEGGGKLLVSVGGRNAAHRLRLTLFESLRMVAEQRPDAQFAIGPVKLASDGPQAIEEAVSGLDDEIAILENGRYLPQPVAMALRATDSITNARAKFVLELGETLLQWLSLGAAADLAACDREMPRTIASIKKHLTGGVTMGRWHELFTTALKELLDGVSVHGAAWRTSFGDNSKRSELSAFFRTLVEVRNAFSHGATASDEHVARKIVDDIAPRLRTLIKHDLRPVLALIPADVELLGFEGELQSYRLTRLIGDGIPASVATYSRRRMNPGLWLCDAIADRAVPLEPFFVRETCPKCGARELFLLTRVDELEFRNPASGHMLKKPIEDLPLSADARDRLLDLTRQK